MALRGIKVIEFAGLAPGPFCGMILADFGARVIRIDKPNLPDMDVLGRGKQSIIVDLKKKEGVNIIRRLCSDADVLIEPFRSGVMEKLGIGPQQLHAENPGLIYARLTGYGQKGPMSVQAGHDINYIATSGVLSYIGRKGEKPYAPVNLLADFAGGGMTCAMGILMALYERTKSGKGQVIDSSMVGGSAYIASWLWKSKDTPYLRKGRGDNMLDGGAGYYETYETADKKYVAIGPLEPHFYRQLLKGLEIDPSDMDQHSTDPEKMKARFTQIFATRTRDEWTEIFKGTDACFTPVLEAQEAPYHPHNVQNETFLLSPSGKYEPAPAPKLSRTPAVDKVLPQPKVGQHTLDILKEAGFSSDLIKQYLDKAVVVHNNQGSKL